VFERSSDGHYVLTAEGNTAKGEKCQETPARFMPDGQEHPVLDFPGLTAVAAHVWYRLTEKRPRQAIFGYDTQLRHFKQQTVWDWTAQGDAVIL